MAATKLDGAGTQKMKTLEEAQMSLTQIHSMVERMGVEVKSGGSVGIFPNQIKRMAGTLQGQLKGQFGMIADMFAGHDPRRGPRRQRNRSFTDVARVRRTDPNPA